eukprot:1437218-Amphidinium_carterae.2
MSATATTKGECFRTPPNPQLSWGWFPPQLRVGEASNPGLVVLTCNSNSWKRAAGLLTIERRASGGLAILSKDGQPQQRFEKGEHWQLGRWSHHLLPYDGGLHIYNIYGYSSDDPLAPETNCALCMEVLISISSLGPWAETGAPWSYEEPQITEEVGYHAACANKACAWILAVQENIDVDSLWRLWCSFSEAALGLPIGSKGSLFFAQRQLAAPAPVEEALPLLSSMPLALSGQVSWDRILLRVNSSCSNCLNAWYQNTAKVDAKKRWGLAVHDEEGFADTPDHIARVELWAWSKLWKLGLPSLQRVPADKGSVWSYHTLQSMKSLTGLSTQALRQLN